MSQDDEALRASLTSLSMTADEAAKREPHPQSLPCTLGKSFVVDGVDTDIWIQIFADRTVVTCSQLPQGRIGSWLLCKRHVLDPLSSKGKADTEVSFLLGAAQRDDPLLQVYAKHVTERIAREQQQTSMAAADAVSPTTTVLLGLSLDRESSKNPAVFRTLVELVARVYREAVVGAAATAAR